jgi:methylenetetrahydrofolate reductase (NADPH)
VREDCGSHPLTYLESVPMATGPGRSIRELLEHGERSFSFEFFPPRDDAGEQQLWDAINALEPYRPSFVSVTYGAGGATRDKTVGITGRIARETSLTPVAHLTCVGIPVRSFRRSSTRTPPRASST